MYWRRGGGQREREHKHLCILCYTKVNKLTPFYPVVLFVLAGFLPLSVSIAPVQLVDTNALGKPQWGPWNLSSHSPGGERVTGGQKGLLMFKGDL